jgi:hypothetical protein
MTSELTEQIIATVPVRTMQLLSERAKAFNSEVEMKLTAVALSAPYRQLADDTMDRFWSTDDRFAGLLANAEDREVIIGAGYHAAVYAATRVRAGFPKPLVLERSNRVGGTFAMTEAPTFYLNSRNRSGRGGLAGDRRASLNYIPGAPIQPANMSMAEYQTNADMAFAIRLCLAEYADVITGAEVTRFNGNLYLNGDNSTYFKPRRVIDARGLGDPVSQSKPESGMFTFPDFMRRMATPWPLQGVRNVAVIGGGDSARCAVEALVGIGPQSSMTIPVLDRVERIDWYAIDLPSTCEGWKEQERGRYQAIGPQLRPDRFGVQLINVNSRRAFPVGLPDGGALIDGRTYDMTIMCTGNATPEISGLPASNDEGRLYRVGSLRVARQSYEYTSVFLVGPHADLGFDDTEFETGIANINNNKVAMFRTGPKTAALAASLS